MAYLHPEHKPFLPSDKNTIEEALQWAKDKISSLEWEYSDGDINGIMPELPFLDEEDSIQEFEKQDLGCGWYIFNCDEDVAGTICPFKDFFEIYIEGCEKAIRVNRHSANTELFGEKLIAFISEFEV